MRNLARARARAHHHHRALFCGSAHWTHALSRLSIPSPPPLSSVHHRSPSRSISSSSPSLLGALSPSTPLLQAKGGAAKKGGPSGPAPAVEEKYDLTKQIPVNLLKEGPEPEYKADSEYPPWVFKLLEEKPSPEEIVMRGLENVPDEHAKMVFKTANRKRIKARNADSASKA
jgi:hypothetical protein